MCERVCMHVNECVRVLPDQWAVSAALTLVRPLAQHGVGSSSGLIWLLMFPLLCVSLTTVDGNLALCRPLLAQAIHPGGLACTSSGADAGLLLGCAGKGLACCRRGRLPSLWSWLLAAGPAGGCLSAAWARFFPHGAWEASLNDRQQETPVI